MQSDVTECQNVLSSPIRLTISTPSSTTNTVTDFASPLRPTATAAATTTTTTTDGFPELSRQLEDTTRTLSKIYRHIGYTSSEIKNNEHKLIHSISMAFKHFLDDAHQFQSELQDLNDKSISILRIILKAIGDPSGIKTIPDLYMRNLIAKGQSPEGTLLNTQKFIKGTKDTVLLEYKQKLLRFLEEAQILASLASRIDNFDSGLLMIIPSWEVTCELKEAFSNSTTLDALFSYIIAVFDEKLNINPFNDLSPDNFKRLQNATLAYEKEANTRIELSKNTSDQIWSLWNELGVDDPLQADVSKEEVHLYREGNNKALSQKQLSRLSVTLSDLKRLKVDRYTEKQRYQTTCQFLWTKLNQDPSFVSHFESSNDSLTLQSLKNYQDEYSRLLEIKKSYTKEFIEDARNEIQRLWESLCYSLDKRNEFVEFCQTDDLNEKLLERHEVEILKLKEEYKMYKPLLELTKQFKDLLLDRSLLEESTKDSSRLIRKNSHKILMEEEKIRKRLIRQLPRVVSDIKQKLGEMKQAGYNLTMISHELLSNVEEEYAKLEKNGKIMPQSSRAISRVPSMAPSRVSSTQTSRSTSRAPTRTGSRTTSNLPSRSTSPVKYTTTTGTAAFRSAFSHAGVQKLQHISATKRTTTITPATADHLTHELSNLSRSNSPNKSYSKTDELQNLLSTPSPLYRSQSSLEARDMIHHDRPTFPHQVIQPRLITRQTSDLTALRNSNRSRIPVPKVSLKPHMASKPLNDVFTSPLRSLSKEQDELVNIAEDQENISMVSDFGDEDRFSNWRKEQLEKLNQFKQQQQPTFSDSQNLL